MDDFSAQNGTTSHSTAASGPHGLAIAALPVYSRSLLKIQVPITVTLAAKKLRVSEIVNLVPGSIIEFAKSCEDPLDLEASSRPIARGECIKIGDKLSFRIIAMRLPDERFQPVKAPTGRAA